MTTTRFAPSPSGYLHLGNMRTALWNYLFAIKNSGSFLVRIENTDTKRSTEEYTQALHDDLKSLSIVYDHSTLQSEQTKNHLSYIQKLIATEKVYPCFCTEERLQELKKSQAKLGLPPRYDGKCRNLQPDEKLRLLSEQEACVWRFAVPTNTQVTLKDPIRKKDINFQTNNLEDFVVQRSDGSFVFLFTNAVDDLHSGITHVIRGEDHISNTPKQILLFNALDGNPPLYVHTALIIGHDKKPLAKRNQAFSVEKLLQKGYLPQAICNFLARLGCEYADSSLLNMQQLAGGFNLEAISVSPAMFREEDLLHWQKIALSQLNEAEWQAWTNNAITQYEENSPQDLQIFANWIRENCLLYQDVCFWAAVVCKFHLAQEAQALLTHEDKELITLVLQQADEPEWQPLIQKIQTATEKKGKALYMPLRIALSGQTHGPNMAPLWSMLEPAERRSRLQTTLDSIE